MIYDLQSLRVKYSNYSNIAQKIQLETKKGNLVKIKRGLYSDDIKIDIVVITNVCYGPSYLSFEYALSYYGLIPERVSSYTSACYNKKNNKEIYTSVGKIEYRSIPNDVFSYGIMFYKNENNMTYKMACKEKAICDMLYSKYPVRTIKDLKILLFDDLRIDEDEFAKLDFSFIDSIADLYHSNTLLTLKKYIKEFTND